MNKLTFKELWELELEYKNNPAKLAEELISRGYQVNVDEKDGHLYFEANE